MFGLDVDTLRNIRKTIAQFPHIEKVLIYGSRAKGNYKAGSDIDITLVAEDLTLKNSVYPLSTALDDLYLPYTFDISIFDQLENPDFVDHILRVGKTFYQKENNVRKGWKETTLGEVCEFRRGLTYKKSDEVPVSKNAILRANNITVETGEINFDEIRFISDEIDIPLSKKVIPGCLLVCTASGSKKHLGKIGIVETDSNYAFGGFMGILVPTECVLPKYLFYLTRSDLYRDFIDALSDGMNINNLKWSQLSQFQVSIPPLPEQKRIVAVLDAAFAAIATATANTKENIANVKELFDSELNSVFQPPQPAEDSVSDVTAEWGMIRLGDVCCLSKKRHNGSLLPFLGMEHIDSGTGQLASEIAPLAVKSSTFHFNGTHLLYGRLRPYLNKVFLPDFEGHCSTEIFPIECGPKLNRRFLFYWLTSETTVAAINRTSTGARMPRANVNALLDFILPLPSLPEQKRIAAFLDKLSAEKQTLVGIYETKVRALTELKQSLLHQAFTGELTADTKAADRSLSEAGV